MQMRQTFDEPQPESDLTEIDYGFEQTRHQMGRLEKLVDKLATRLEPVITPGLKNKGEGMAEERKMLSPLAENLQALEERIITLSLRMEELLDVLAL